MNDRLVFQPDASYSLRRGIDAIVEAIRPTLGPIPRTVAISQPLDGKPPELLDKGGLIARRISDLPDRDADMGAMLLRGMLWQLYEDCGDGTATAAVLFQAIYGEGMKYIAAGGNAMRLRERLLAGMTAALDSLDAMTRPIAGKDQLAQLAECVCHDPELARHLGEVFDFIGEHGQLDVRRGHTRSIEQAYLKGMYWKQGAVSRAMLRGGKEPDRIVLKAPAILLSDLEISDPAELLPIVNMLMRAKAKSLLLVGSKFSESVINLILSNKKPEKFRIVAVKTPGSTDDHRRAHLSDMAVLTGAIPLFAAAGDTLAKPLVRPEVSSERHRTSYFGSAQQVWVERTLFGLVSDRDEQTELTEHLADLLERLEYAGDKDSEAFLRERIGKILGGAAILRVGDAIPARMDSRIASAKETAKSLRAALRHGILPGGGLALWSCRDSLDTLGGDEDARAARRILLQALEAPLRALCHNAGVDSGKVADLEGAPAGHGIDLRAGEIAPMLEAGVIDVAEVTKAALRGAATSAALALTIDVLLHHKTPEQSYTP